MDGVSATPTANTGGVRTPRENTPGPATRRTHRSWGPDRADVGVARGHEKGLLGYRMGVATIIQCWRSFEHREAFARDPGDLHRPAWLTWYRRDPRGRTGIGHETFLVRAGEYEAIYSDMPEEGLAAAGRTVPLAGNSSARLRIRRAGQEPAPVPTAG